MKSLVTHFKTELMMRPEISAFGDDEIEKAAYCAALFFLVSRSPIDCSIAISAELLCSGMLTEALEVFREHLQTVAP